MYRHAATSTTGNIVLPKDSSPSPSPAPYAAGRRRMTPRLTRRRPPVRPSVLACFIPAAGLVAIILWIIWTRTALVPYWDEWVTVSLVVAADHSQLTLGDLWAFHAGVHRIVLTRLVDLVLIRLTNWNRQVEMTFDLTVSLAGAWLLYSLLRDSLRSARLALVLVVPVSLLYFSLAQFGNWFSPFQLQFITSLLGLLLAVRALTLPARRLPWRRFALGLLGAVIGMLSALPGMIIWFAVLPTLVARMRSRRGRLQFLFWLAATCAAWTIYLQGFGGRGDFAYLSRRELIAYVLTYLGAPIGYPDVTRSELFGLVALALWPVTVAMYLLLGGRLRRLVPWLDASLFVVLCTMATVAGRVAGGALSALSSRYQIFSSVWWIALLVMGGITFERLVRLRAGRPVAHDQQPWQVWTARVRVRLVERRSIVRVGSALLLALCCVSLVAANITGLRDALLWQDVQRGSQYRLYDYGTLAPSCLDLYYPEEQVTLELSLIASLAQTHYGIFAVPLSERQRLAQSEATDPSQVCPKPYHFIDDVTQPSGQQAAIVLTAATTRTRIR